MAEEQLQEVTHKHLLIVLTYVNCLAHQIAAVVNQYKYQLQIWAGSIGSQCQSILHLNTVAVVVHG
jgi:hypothetical protein